MITWIVLAIVLVFGIIITLLKDFLSRKLGRSRALIPFFASLLATFTGVFLGFILANYQVELQEKSNLESLLYQTEIELRYSTLEIENLYNELSSNAANDLLITEALDFFPFTNLITLDTLVSSTLFPKYLPWTGYIIRCKKSVDSMLSQINSTELSPQKRLSIIPRCIDEMACLRSIVLTEHEFITGNITDDEVKQRCDDFYAAARAGIIRD